MGFMGFIYCICKERQFLWFCFLWVTNYGIKTYTIKPRII